MNYYKLLELITDLNEAREDRKILAKQLRDERSFSSALCVALLVANEELHKLRKKQELVDQLDFFEEPDQWAARHGLY